jgi:hypothetical protein
MREHGDFPRLGSFLLTCFSVFSVLATAAARPDTVPNDLTASDWSSIRQQYEQHRHRAIAVDGSHQAHNPGQQWLTRFDGRGFLTRPDTGTWRWGLELQSYGFVGHERALTMPPRVSTAGSRVTYDWNAVLQEWFVNDQRGLEHGFILLERPLLNEPLGSQGNEAGTSPHGSSESSFASAASPLNNPPSTLNLFLTVRGGLRPEVEADGRGVRFVDARGTVAVTYAGLIVRDAEGRDLPARFKLVPGKAGSLQPAASGATPAGSPTGDGAPCQESKLLLAIDEHGARYPLTIDPVAQQAYLKASNTGGSDGFGYSVAVSGDTVVVGAPYEESAATGVNGDESNNSASQSGAAYVFVRNGRTWTQHAYLKASNAERGDWFGCSVAVSGDTVVVGAYLESSAATGVDGNQGDNSAATSGAAYVFVRNGTNWSQQAYLKASNAEAYEAFGWSVAVAGDTVVVGALGESSAATGVNGDQNNNNAPGSGAAYVFVRSGTNWSQQAYLKAFNTRSGDQFGCSVAVAGDTVAVGALYGSSLGAVYVFVRGDTTWTQQACLTASNAEAGDGFGYSLAAAGDTVVVGAPYESSAATGVNGNQSDDSAFRSGAAYVFARSGTTWSQQAYLKASDTGEEGWFGYSVAVSGDATVVGGYAGAAYVFGRSGTTWTQQALLKGSNTEATDFFARSVAVSGDTVVVGAFAEFSAATGVNGDQGDNSAGGAGAAYVFNVVATAPADIAVQQPGGHDLTNESAAVSFGSGLVGSSASLTFTIYNLGDYDLTGLGLLITGPQAADFVVTNSPSASLSPCACTTFTIRFSPGATGPRTAVLRILSNDTDESPFGILLTGTGLTPGQLVYLKASNTEGGYGFGYSVAMSGDTAVVGAYQEASATTGVNGNQNDNSAWSAGAAYVFVRSGTTWIQQAYLKASNAESGDWFGWSVAVSGDTVVVGAPYEYSAACGVNGNQGDNSAPNSGAAYVFVRSGMTWSQQAYLKASNTEGGDSFGYAVAISDNTVIVGALYESSAATGVNGNQGDNSAVRSGAAYVFARSGTTWIQQAYLKASNTGVRDGFGLSVAVSGDTAVVGAPFESSAGTGVNDNQSDNSASASGAAYVFARSGTTWSQQAYLKASNTGVDDSFGRCVAVSGNTVVVAAPWEDSATTGVNGNQSDNYAARSGAAFVFVRSGATWSQQAYLKASNTGVGDEFGCSVAVAGDMLVVGAPYESSAATGVSGNQSDDDAFWAGAAYLFVRSGTTWSQQSFLKASNTGERDFFGFSVAVAGDAVAVGAYHEDSAATGVNGNQSDNSAEWSGAAYLFTGIGRSVALTLAPDGTGGYFLRWRGVSGLAYRLQRASSLTGTWSTVVTRTGPPVGDMVFQDTFPLPGKALYRVVEGN